ncbi:hypothetical protein D3C78_1335040 [compost metagenome]
MIFIVFIRHDTELFIPPIPLSLEKDSFFMDPSVRALLALIFAGKILVFELSKQNLTSFSAFKGSLVVWQNSSALNILFPYSL